MWALCNYLNIGASVLTISSVAYSSHVTNFVLPEFAGVVYPEGSAVLSGTVDTSLAAGAKTGDITVYSDASNQATYSIDITYTLV